MAALASGVLIGAGAGIYLHSFGSVGGSDVIAIILNQKFNVKIGKFYFYFNLVLFGLSIGFLNLDIILYSLVLSFVVSQVTDDFLSMFSQRKMVIIISDKSESIAKAILKKLQRGSTFLFGRGAYTGRRKKVLLTVVNNYQLKRLEEAVFTIDSEAFFITGNTFSVIGKGFSRRKFYWVLVVWRYSRRGHMIRNFVELKRFCEARPSFAIRNSLFDILRFAVMIT